MLKNIMVLGFFSICKILSEYYKKICADAAM